MPLLGERKQNLFAGRHLGAPTPQKIKKAWLPAHLAADVDDDCDDDGGRAGRRRPARSHAAAARYSGLKGISSDAL